MVVVSYCLQCTIFVDAIMDGAVDCGIRYGIANLGSAEILWVGLGSLIN